MQNVYDPNQSQPQDQPLVPPTPPSVPVDQTQTQNLTVSSSPIDHYQPPASSSAPDDQIQMSGDSTSTQNYPNTPPPIQSSPDQSAVVDTPPTAPIDDYVPPAAPPTMDAVSAEPSNPGVSEDIADQNIFEMLGVTDGTPEQREQFLDELQAVIWDDFIEHDTQLLLTDEEQKQLQEILKPDPKAMENQEKAVVFLEKLIPDLEEIMLEKALQLKEEMFRERLRAMTELYRNDQDKQQTIASAQSHVDAKEWHSATTILNGVK